MDIKGNIKQVLKDELDGLRSCLKNVGESAVTAVESIAANKGKLIISGLGKSGLIAQKLAATFSSTGTPSIFVHPTEAGHGDLGIIETRDLILLISFNGEQNEFEYFYNLSGEKNVKIIALTGKADSTLVEKSDISIVLNVKEESSVLPYAPSVSSTATLAMGDALALTVAKMRNFNPEDFARLHPGGTLGRLLSVKVSAIMRKGNSVPILSCSDSMQTILLKVSSFRLGAALVCGDNLELKGIITDGDLRRIFEKHSKDAFDLIAEDVMSEDPSCATPDQLGKDALEKMEQKKITVLPVIKGNTACGIIHMHDILGGNKTP